MKPLAVGALALAVAALSSGAPAGAALPAPPQTRVVVQSTGDRADAARAVEAAGGRVTRDLPIVDGVSATVPVAARARLAEAPGVLAVTDDLPVATASTTSVREGQQAALVETGAHTLHQTGIDGRGTTVALIDTGIAQVRDLAGRVRPVRDPGDPTKTVPCVNFSGEVDSRGEPDCNDSYGHGTFVAGLIAGSGATSGGDYRGAAPAAELVSVKIAGRDGGADVTKVLAAIQWVVSFRDEHGIDVLNLSLGTDSRNDPRIDPLNRAVQRATAAGIVVVVAAGNAGASADGTSRVFKPGDDPSVITVGAVDDLGTGSRLDDRVPAFTSRGAVGQGKPDLAAPGARLVSLNAPGSYVEEFAAGRGVVDATYRRGSGSSFATGLVSGMAALLEQARPGWSPARVKAALTATADPSRLGQPLAVGAGIARVGEALASTVTGVPTSVSSEDLGALQDARGSVNVVVAGCTGLAARLDERCTTGIEGETTSQAGLLPQPFRAEEFAADPWTAQTWYESQWAGNSWLGNSWLGNSWLGNSWLGNSWLGDSSGADASYGEPRRGSAFYGTSE